MAASRRISGVRSTSVQRASAHTKIVNLTLESNWSLNVIILAAHMVGCLHEHKYRMLNTILQNIVGKDLFFTFHVLWIREINDKQMRIWIVCGTLPVNQYA